MAWVPGRAGICFMAAFIGPEAALRTEPGAARAPLIEHFAALEDPRQAWKVIHPLPEVLLLVLRATLAGADDFVELEAWGGEHLGFLRRFRPYADGIPSHDTLNDVTNALDAELFAARFTAWVEGLREAAPDLVAVDGKTSRRTHARAKGRDPLHLVSAWASRQRLVLGQQATDGKSNEITAIPLLLERLALTGALVTIDAMGGQRAIARAILDAGADDLLAVKANRPALHGEVARYFADAPASEPDAFEVTEGEHGRIEVRRHAIGRTVDWLATDRRFPGEPRFPGPAASALVEATVERPGRAARRERRYYLSSAPLDARLCARAVRGHWHIATRLHWVMDVVFRDDLCRLRTGHGPRTMAAGRHMAMNLVGTASGRHSLKVRRKRAAWNVGYLETLLRQNQNP